MDAIECIKKRMSIRAFKPEKVPKDLLMEVVNIAKWSRCKFFKDKRGKLRHYPGPPQIIFQMMRVIPKHAF
jgi:hypothetical protein